MSDIYVNVISHSGQSALVEWSLNGNTRRTYILKRLISQEGTVSHSELELGIEETIGIEEMLLSTQFSQEAACIAEALEHAGIKNRQSLQNAPRKVGHICGRDIYQIVEVLNRAFDKGA